MSSKRECLIDGKTRDYHVAAPYRKDKYADPYRSDVFTCIGDGYIYSIEGDKKAYTKKVLLTFYKLLPKKVKR